MRVKLLVSTLASLIALAVASSAGAGAWTTYFGPATMYQSTPSPQTGSNYWTNNRVYRPLGHPFILGYKYGSSFHYSTENSGDNPFYFPSFGYNYSFCMWAYWDDLSPTVSPVTCQAYA
jgi:hypothetical protein